MNRRNFLIGAAVAAVVHKCVEDPARAAPLPYLANPPWYVGCNCTPMDWLPDPQPIRPDLDLHRCHTCEGVIPRSRLEDFEILKLDMQRALDAQHAQTAAWDLSD